MRLYAGLVAIIALQRLAELVLSRRNAARTLARGGIEFGREQLPAMMALHTLFLLSCLAEAHWRGPVFQPLRVAPLIALLVAAQAVRLWTLRTLGPLWNTRVIVIPGLPRVTGGPYRLCAHPNYAAVVVEMVALPGVAGAWITAAVFSLANAWLLRARIRCEEDALRTHARGTAPRGSEGAG